VDEDVPVNTTLFRVGTSLSNFFISWKIKKKK
jgi:hypothetical protein